METEPSTASKSLPVKLLIEVSDDDCRLGQKFDCSHCPVALAFRRALALALGTPIPGSRESDRRNLGDLEVETHHLYWRPPAERFFRELQLPAFVTNFIRVYDRNTGTIPPPPRFELHLGQPATKAWRAS